MKNKFHLFCGGYHIIGDHHVSHKRFVLFWQILHHHTYTDEYVQRRYFQSHILHQNGSLSHVELVIFEAVSAFEHPFTDLEFNKQIVWMETTP